MKVSVTAIDLAELDVELLVVPVLESEDGGRAALPPPLDSLADRLGDDFRGRDDEDVVLYPDGMQARRVVLVGLGSAGRLNSERLRVAASRGADAAVERRVRTVGMLVPEVPLDAELATQSLVEGFLLGGYRFSRYKTGDEQPFAGVERLVLQASTEDRVSRRGADRGRIVAESVMTARDLVNLSPDEKTPTLLARAIEKSGKRFGYEVDVWEKNLIEEEGMRGLLAVNRGSVEPPTFTIATWQPDNAVNSRPIVLVGKGVVFDTGGLSLKSTKGSMDQMKSDMAGAAAVVGVMEAVARLELPVYVLGLIPATDNRPGENAFVPGDVVRMHSGKTVEVLNTDAEGRLILADALSYAKTYRPELVIDLATLTGAAVVALGHDVAAVMTAESNGSAERLEGLLEASRISGDLIHPMPMFEEYGRLIQSDVADLKNSGERWGAAITAAKFLEQFADYPWIHIDIAGPAFLEEARPYRQKGGTGFGVRLLVEFLRSYSSPRRRRG
ncbi:MAG TPA: leucyl aminopeptidase [Rhodothermales bacterium]